jgi:predicted dehydrogenase/threonine dehydrogenase-like Zn-dependent dehydrogenase
MRQVLIKQGRAVVEEVPAPAVEPGRVLVQLDHSCISAGTELSGLQASAQPLWKRALAQPGKVKQAWRMVGEHGIRWLHDKIRGKLASAAATGYSAAGLVREVGAGVDDLRPGDPVACAGAQCAHHAEIICVPRNLVVPLPAGADLAAASTVALGAIALQGVRRAQPTLGETFVVIGLGIVGQLTAQLLRVNGCRVIGVDLDRERVALALRLGMHLALGPGEGTDAEQVARLTEGVGADGVIVTAATPAHSVMATAFRMCRKKGRVVLVGDVGLHLNRADFYEKELDFFISTSYGPGRYDRRYEEEGLDYPVGHVRWTEARNMAEYLRLVADGQVVVGPLVSAVYPIEEAPTAYERLSADGPKPLLTLLSYPRGQEYRPPTRVVENRLAPPARPGRLAIAVIGAGSFAQGVHLPNLQRPGRHYSLRAVVCRGGHRALSAARQFGAAYAATDYRKVLDDPEVGAVLIATRHNLHAGQALEALRAGKHVLVEKPLALTETELDALRDFYEGPQDGKPLLLTGYNRRFSPHIQHLARLTRGRAHPLMINYRMNAGYLPLDHWVHGPEGGGRNRGEACHIYDLFTYLTGSRVASVTVESIAPGRRYYSRHDNFVATLRFEDGSVAALTYTALGSPEHPKEQMEVYWDGKVASLSDYKRTTVSPGKKGGLNTGVVQKGHREELEAFARAVAEGGPWPIPLWQQMQVVEIACRVEASLHDQATPSGVSLAA